MSAQVTIDLNARIVGYENSLRKMEQAFSHVNVGSKIGEQIKRALTDAQKEFRALQKNPVPSVTSENQLMNTLNRADRVGEAIQRVGALLQQVRTQDIDFGSFGNEITEIIQHISNLNTQIDGDLTNGIKEAINSSSQLKSVFDQLHIDIEGKSALELLAALNEEAQGASKAVAAAQAEVDKLAAARDRVNKSRQDLLSSPFAEAKSKDNYISQIDQIKKTYGTVDEDFATSFRNNFRNQFKDTVKGKEATNILTSFFNGLTPENIKEHVQKLREALEASGRQFATTKEFYDQLFAFSGANVKNSNQLASSFLWATPKEDITSQLRGILSQVSGVKGIKGAATTQITNLLDAGNVTEAFQTLKRAIERGWKSVQDALPGANNNYNEAVQKLQQAQSRLEALQNNQGKITGASAELQNAYEVLLAKVEPLERRVQQLAAQLEEIQRRKNQQIKGAGKEGSDTSQQFATSADEVAHYTAQLQKAQRAEQMIGRVESVIQRWFSVYAAIRMVGNAIRSVISTIKELDKTITEIAIVTNMTQNDLWGQMSTYVDIAKQYATSIAGVYKVSQLYYQQGLQTADVMALTEQTLKLARISGLEYADAANYMTNAVRSFKMEMTEAQQVVDVYSALAASSASDVTQLATAMSKTASSAQAVGSSFENTAAMMAVMIEATREAPEKY